MFIPTSEDLQTYTRLLDIAHQYAIDASGCRKVLVGSLLLHGESGEVMAFGANRAIPDVCRMSECLRVQKYGEDSRLHRNPEDCRAIHSEVDAIVSYLKSCSTASSSAPTNELALFVTRYPCEACARVIVAAGIPFVVYGRAQKISRETEQIFYHGGVEVYWHHHWTEADTTR